jgi:hypothetical protein
LNSDHKDLQNGLWRQYQPVGRAEEIEVERIALCYWRLKRAWRYENAVNLAARRDFVRAELAYQEPYCKEQDKEVVVQFEIGCEFPKANVRVADGRRLRIR